MAKPKTVKFESTAEGTITVTKGEGRGTLRFEPGVTRTYETDDPIEIRALRANSDLKEVKK